MVWEGGGASTRCCSLGEEGVPEVENLEIGPEFFFTGGPELAGSLPRNAEFCSDGVEGDIIEMVASHGMSLFRGEPFECAEQLTEDIPLLGLIDGRGR